jgi:hypothetical protein
MQLPTILFWTVIYAVGATFIAGYALGKLSGGKR